MRNKIFLPLAVAILGGCSSVHESEVIVDDGLTEYERFIAKNEIIEVNDVKSLYAKYDINYTHKEYSDETINLYIEDKVMNPGWVKITLNGDSLDSGVAVIPLNNKKLSKKNYLSGSYDTSFLMGFDAFNIKDGDIERLNVYDHLFHDTHYAIDNSKFLRVNHLKESEIEFIHAGSGDYEVYGMVTFFKYNPQTNKTWLIVDDDVKIFKNGESIDYKFSSQKYWQ